MGLKAIMSALAAVPVNSISGLDTDNTQSAINSVPIRVLSPLSMQNEGTGNRVTLGASPTVTVVWELSDLCLYAHASSGSGLEAYLSDLIDYADAYLLAIQSRAFHIGTGTIESLKFDWGIFEFPVGSGLTYFGIDTSLNIREVL